MEDVKDKMKGFMKKVNKSFSSPSSSSGKFQGQGRVLGSAAPAGAQPGVSPLAQRFSAAPAAPRPGAHKAAPPRPAVADPRPSGGFKPPDVKPSSAKFGPFDALLSSGKRSVNGTAPEVVECPVCAQPFASEEEVSAHVESCLAANGGGRELARDDAEMAQLEAREELAGRVGEFVSSEPPEESAEVVLRLMRNVVREPENDKFRRIRMSNPKIKEAVCSVKGAVELMECVGFRLGEEDGETWAKMGLPEEKEISLIKEAIALLERWKVEDSAPTPTPSDAVIIDSLPEQGKVDRQVRVFFSVPESEAAKIDLPDSFYKLSAQELKRETELRKKKIEESQILIPKSYKEKQMKAARKRYKATCIRIQFPDGVVLQGVFRPWESTTVLYEFVQSALKEPSLEFELLRPAVPKLQLIPRFPRSGERPPTLEEEELVPSALVKFKATETDSILFTGLINDLLEISEPLTTMRPAVDL